jgi:hypothetical protein
MYGSFSYFIVILAIFIGIAIIVLIHEIKLVHKGIYLEKTAGKKRDIYVYASIGALLGFVLPRILFPMLSADVAERVVLVLILFMSIVLLTGIKMPLKWYYARKYEIEVIPTWKKDEVEKNEQ